MCKFSATRLNTQGGVHMRMRDNVNAIGGKRGNCGIAGRFQKIDAQKNWGGIKQIFGRSARVFAQILYPTVPEPVRNIMRSCGI